MERLRVMTLNIWNRQGPWEARRELIRKGLRELSPDVVALQEVLRLAVPDGSQALSQADDLARDLGYQVAYGPAWNLDRHGLLDFGNAVLSRLPILEQHNVTLPNPMRHETRGLLYTLLGGPSWQVPFFVTHLDWQLDLSPVRCQQVAFVTETMATLEAAARGREGADVLPAILAGDFNAEPESDEIRYLRGRHGLVGPGGETRGVYFADAFGLCGDGPGETFSRSNPYAAREREPNRRLDYLFIGSLDKDLRGEPLSARRCFTEPEGGVFASDHFGVLAEVQVARRTKEPF